jgi:mono/diheme cytochrome c family protein
LSKKKAVALTALLAFAGVGFACSSGVGEKTPPPANNAQAPPATTAPTNAAPPATSQIAGMPADVQSVFAARCAMCHGQDAKGKGNAPNIFEVKDKHTADEWVAYLKNPKIWDKDNKMPPVANLADADAKKIGEWLAMTTGKPGATGGEKGEKGEKKDEKTEGTKKP